MLTKTNCKPFFDTLNLFLNKIKSNFSNKSSKLGVGRHKHLELSFREVEYNSGAPRNQHVQPVTLGLFRVRCYAEQKFKILA